MLGFIFHVGPYSFFGYDDIETARRRKIQTGSEFYLERLQTKEFKKVSGSEKTKAHHSRYNIDYFKAPFMIERNSIEQWLDLCVKCKATYVIITAKNQDGYCLWNTSTTPNKPYNDILQIFREEALKRGLQFGIYYSWYEFLKPMTLSYWNEFCIPQLNELIQYNPHMFWFDGDWKIKQKTIIDQIGNFVCYLRSNNVIVNDRITKENFHLASYFVGPNHNIPQIPMQNWQHFTTIGISWGYNKEQQKKDYKSGTELYNLYNQVSSNGGTLLLNVGPKFNGELDSNELESLLEFSTLI